jgi:hypothetical protein
MALTPLHPSYNKRVKRAKVKPLNYSQVTVLQQGPDENTLTFPQHLKDAIQKHTTVEPESQVGGVLLKDKFLTQSTPDICRKLQKSVAEGEKSLDQLMQLATSVYCNRDVTKKREKDKKTLDLIATLSGSAHPTGTYIPSLLPLWTAGALPQGMPKRGTAWGDSLRYSSSPHRDLALSAKVIIRI